VNCSNLGYCSWCVGGYQEESFYSENDFSLILENRNEFKSQLIKKFRQSLISISAVNFEFNLDQLKKLALRPDASRWMY
jgi:hypothetical protein